MITKNKIYTIIGCLIAFFIGMIFQYYIIEKKGNSFNKQINEILKYNNEILDCDIHNRINAIKEWGGDTTDEWSQLLIKMGDVSNYFKQTFSSEQDIYKFSLDSMYLSLNKEISIDLFYDIAKEIDIKNLTFEEAKIYINICRNNIIRAYFVTYNDTYTVGLSRGRILFVPKKNVVKIGEPYETNIYCEIRDLAKSFTLEFEDGNKYKDSNNIYREVVTKKGLNVRKGKLHYLDNGKRKLLPFEFSFYVE